MGKHVKPSILDVVGNLRPDAAVFYRLIDRENRVFPPREHPALRAEPRVEIPSVPPGTYSIRFEDLQGKEVPYTEDGALSEIQLDRYAVAHAPEDVEVRRERSYQKIEKREHRYREQAIKNEGIAALMALLIESQKNAAKRDKSMIKMVKQFTKGQSELFKQQNEMLAQSGKLQPAAPAQNWPGAASHIVDTIGRVVVSAVAAYGDDRKQPSAGRLLDAAAQPALADSPSTPPASVPSTTPRVEASTVEAPGTPDLPSAVPLPSLPTEAKASPAVPSPDSPSAKNPDPPPSGDQPPSGDPPPAVPLSGSSAAKGAPPAAAPPASAAAASRQARDLALTPEPSAPRTRAQLAWRLIKRRIIALSEGQLLQVVSSRQGLLQWLSWIAEPADLLGWESR